MGAALQLGSIVTTWEYRLSIAIFDVSKETPPKNKQTKNIYVKYPDLAVPEILLKFFKLACGTDFAQGPPVCNLWPIRSVLVIPALPTLSWSLRKDLPESWPSCLSLPPAQKGLAVTRANQNTEAWGWGGGGGRELLTKEKVDEQPSNPTSSKCMGLTDFNYIAF